ncbi:MAG: ribonuclease E/G [Pseudomonadota bacterium]
MTERSILVQLDPKIEGDRPDSTRPAAVAVVEGGRLIDLIIDPPQADWIPQPGLIGTAKVARLLGDGRGAFADGPGVSLFLKDRGALRAGETALIQVSGYAEPGKAIPASTHPLIKKRHIILTPSSPGVNLSRAIPKTHTAELESLKPTVEAILDQRLRGAGAILRTDAPRVTHAQIVAELEEAIENWLSIGARFAEWSEPRWLWGGEDALSLIGLWSTDGTRPDIWFAGKGAEDGTVARNSEASLADLHGFHRIFDGPDLFDHFGIWEQIQGLGEVTLPSGGTVIVEATRAFVTVDVNTKANFSGGAAMTVNVEACRELPRLLRLLGLGGQIIVDFAPLKKTHRKKIEETLRAAFRKCPVETTLAGWTPLGNFELQRKRERRPLELNLHFRNLTTF